MCETARNVPIAELPLSINITIEFVGITRKRRVISENNRAIPYAPRTGAGNDGLDFANLRILKSVRCPAEIVREPSRKRQFVEGMNPVGSEIIEFPVGVGIRLLQGVISPHAHVERYDVGLAVRKVIGSAWKMRRVTVNGEQIAGQVVAVSHAFEDRRVGGQDGAKLGVPVATRCRINCGYG